MRWFKKKRSVRPLPGTEVESGVILCDLLSASVIKLDLEAADKEEVLEEMVDLLVRAGQVKDRAAALSALREREALGSTGIGGGVAIPHGKHESIERLVAALGMSRDGIEFDAVDGKPVNVVFVLLARADNPGPHIQALAEIAQLVQAPRFVRRMVEAENAADVLAFVRSEE